MNVKLVVSNGGNRTNELRNERKRRRSEARLRGTDAASEPTLSLRAIRQPSQWESSADRVRNLASPCVADMSHAVCHATPPASVLVVLPTRQRSLGWKLSCASIPR
jgi:hypothetical protein